MITCVCRVFTTVVDTRDIKSPPESEFGRIRVWAKVVNGSKAHCSIVDVWSGILLTGINSAVVYTL